MAALPPPLRNPPQDTTSTWSHSTARTLCRSLTLSLSLHAAGSLSHTRNSRRAPYLGDNASFSLPASQSFLTSPRPNPSLPPTPSSQSKSRSPKNPLLLLRQQNHGSTSNFEVKPSSPFPETSRTHARTHA